MGEDRQRRGAAETGIEPLVDRRDDVGDPPVPGRQPRADRRFALAAVPGQPAQEPGGLAPAGGATIVVDHAMTWSPENSACASGSAKARWFIVWPGVSTATRVQPRPDTESPSAMIRSGA